MMLTEKISFAGHTHTTRSLTQNRDGFLPLWTSTDPDRVTWGHQDTSVTFFPYDDHCCRPLPVPLTWMTTIRNRATSPVKWTSWSWSTEALRHRIRAAMTIWIACKTKEPELSAAEGLRIHN